MHQESTWRRALTWDKIWKIDRGWHIKNENERRFSVETQTARWPEISTQKCEDHWRCPLVVRGYPQIMGNQRTMKTDAWKRGWWEQLITFEELTCERRSTEQRRWPDEIEGGWLKGSRGWNIGRGKEDNGKEAGSFETERNDVEPFLSSIMSPCRASDKGRGQYPLTLSASNTLESHACDQFFVCSELHSRSAEELMRLLLSFVQTDKRKIQPCLPISQDGSACQAGWLSLLCCSKSSHPRTVTTLSAGAVVRRSRQGMTPSILLSLYFSVSCSGYHAVSCSSQLVLFPSPVSRSAT